jgi:hypothetical protein
LMNWYSIHFLPALYNFVVSVQHPVQKASIRHLGWWNQKWTDIPSICSLLPTSSVQFLSFSLTSFPKIIFCHLGWWNQKWTEIPSIFYLLLTSSAQICGCNSTSCPKSLPKHLGDGLYHFSPTTTPPKISFNVCMACYSMAHKWWNKTHIIQACWKPTKNTSKMFLKFGGKDCIWLLAMQLDTSLKLCRIQGVVLTENSDTQSRGYPKCQTNTICYQNDGISMITQLYIQYLFYFVCLKR